MRSLDANAYGAIEVGTATARLALNAPPGPAARGAVQSLADRLSGLRSPTAFGAWDACFLLFREGLEALLVLAALLTFLGRSNQSSRAPWVWGGAGAGLGFLSGLTGVGGGIFLSPLVVLLGWGNVREASGVAAPFILVNSIAGLIGRGLVTTAIPGPTLPWLAAVLVGGVVGSWLGSRRLPMPSIRRLLAVVLVLAGAKMLFGLG